MKCDSVRIEYMDESAFIVARAIVDAAIASRGTYQAPVGQLEQLGFFARQGVKVRLKAIQPKDDGKTWLLNSHDRDAMVSAAKDDLAGFSNKLIG